MKIRQDLIPRTFEEACGIVITSLEDDDVVRIKAAKSAIQAGKNAHRNVGTLLMMQWGLVNRDTPLRQDFRKLFDGLAHPADIVGFVLEFTAHAVRQEDWDIRFAVAKSKAHWDAMGRNYDGSLKT